MAKYRIISEDNGLTFSVEKKVLWFKWKRISNRCHSNAEAIHCLPKKIRENISYENFFQSKKADNDQIPMVMSDKYGYVKCPYCNRPHRHGGNGNGIASGHRQPDCGNSVGYIIVPPKDATNR